MAQKAIQSLDEFLGSIDKTVSVATKAGIALYPSGGTMAERLIRSATDAVQAIALDGKTDINFATSPGNAPH
mgnify:FL=1